MFRLRLNERKQHQKYQDFGIWRYQKWPRYTDLIAIVFSVHKIHLDTRHREWQNPADIHQLFQCTENNSFIKCPCACTENSKSFVGPNQTSAHEFREVWWLPRRLSSRPLTSLLFRPSLTFFLFWNIVITCKLREVTSRYSGLQSLSRTPWRGEGCLR